MKRIAGVFIIAQLLCSPALVAEEKQAEQNTGFYIGLGLGESQFDDDGYFDRQNMDDSEFAGKLYGGYRLNPYLSLEATLTGMGTYKATSYSSEINSDFGVLGFSVLGQLPLPYGMAIYGELGFGVGTITQEVTYVTPAGRLVTDDDSGDGVAGIYGAGWRIIPPNLRLLEFRVRWQHYAFSANTTRIQNGFTSRSDEDLKFDFVFVGAALNF